MSSNTYLNFMFQYSIMSILFIGNIINIMTSKFFVLLKNLLGFKKEKFINRIMRLRTHYIYVCTHIYAPLLSN